MSDPSSPTCPACGTPLDGGACPRCLMLAAMMPTAHSADTPRQPPPPIETVQAAFPQLEIIGLIGQGGMGCVFKVRQPKLDRIAALKLLPASLAERDAAFAGRFEREGQLLARLHHPNIVAVHDSGTAGGFFYLLMEFVEGVNLRQAMRSSRFTPAQALAIVPHICDALQFAHDEGVLHRDIKPENILLDGKGRVKLADFGIAKLVSDPTDPSDQTDRTDLPHLTQHGTALGTPSYMAPEQRDTPADVDNRADIYSLGVVFYELLTGELPAASFAPPSAKSDADPRVDAIVQQALEKERDRRQRSAGEMKTQVETLASFAPALAPRKSWSTRLSKAATSLALAMVIAFLLQRYVVQFFVAATNAAAPEIPLGSRVIVWKLTHNYAAGDVIAYKHEGRANVGRVLGSDAAEIEVKRNDKMRTFVPRKAIVGKVISVFWRASSPPVSTSTMQPPNEQGWGVADQGVSVRLRAEKRQWTSGEIPTLKADLRNDGSVTLTAVQSQETWKLEVDGVNYEWRGAFHLQGSPLPPGRVYSDTLVTLGAEWKRTKILADDFSPQQALALSPGRHTIRLAPSIGLPGATKGIGGLRISSVSNPVEIEIVETANPAVVVSTPWGEAVNGVAVQLHADFTAWTADEFPALNARVRNQGTGGFPISLKADGGEVEVDGHWYAWKPGSAAKNSLLAPGAECSIPVALVANWQSESGQPLQLSPMQHIVRFAIPSGNSGARVLSNPIKLAIADSIGRRAVLVAKYMPGYTFRSERLGADSLAEVLIEPAGEKVNLGEMRQGWRGIPSLTAAGLPGARDRTELSHWDNSELVEFIRPLRLKIATASEAADVARIIMTVLSGSGNLERRALEATASPSGWVVAMPYVGPPAQVPFLGPIELILKDGVLDDIKQRASD